MGIATTALVSVSTSHAAAATPTSNIGIYVGPGDATDASAVNAQVGGSLHYAMDFLDPSSWSAMDNPSWFLSQWAGSGFSMIWGVPMLPTSGGSLAAGAAGAYNGYFATLARNMVAGGQGSSIIRLGWEFNLSGSTWFAGNDPASWVAYWRQIVTTMRSVPGANFRFEWNPNIGTQSLAPDAAWPGRSYVDIIGMDVYDAHWPAMLDPTSEWNYLLTQPYGLNWLASFAGQQGLPIAFPEWGLWNDGSPEGSGDNATFIDQMSGWIKTHNVANAVYWDYGTSTFAVNPNAAAAFRRDFTGATTSSAPATQSTTTSTSTSTSTAPTSGAASRSPVLRVGDVLTEGHALWSPNGAYFLVLQTDGNLVEYGPHGALWASSTASPGDWAVMQADGNFVIYSATYRALWSSWTGGRGPSSFFLVMQSDGNVVSYWPDGVPVWADNV